MLYKLCASIVTGLLVIGLVLTGRETGFAQESKEAKDVKVDKEIVIKPVDNQMKYQTTEFTVKAGTKVRIIMDNIATIEAMQHNVVVLKPDTKAQEVGLAAIQAGEKKGYIPEHDGIMFYTDIAKPGEKTEVVFTVPPPGDYPYICTYPGHYATMQGVMHSVAEE